MMKHISVAAVLSALVLFCAAAAFAQGCPYRWQGSGGWGMGGAYNRMWDSSKVETLKGTVASIETAIPMRGMHYAVVVILKTPGESIPVHLGPQWYIERLDLKLQKGDSIVVKGSRVTLDGKPIIIAGEIDKGGQSVILRNDAGVPAWAGWRK
jgi:hypothetical protein